MTDQNPPGDADDPNAVFEAAADHLGNEWADTLLPEGTEPTEANRRQALAKHFRSISARPTPPLSSPELTPDEAERAWAQRAADPAPMEHPDDRAPTDAQAARHRADMLGEALAAAVNELEARGPCAVARPYCPDPTRDFVMGWYIDVVHGDNVLARILLGDSAEFPPASAGHRLIEKGWMVLGCAHFAPRRPAGWHHDETGDRWTAPVERNGRPA